MAHLSGRTVERLTTAIIGVLGALVGMGLGSAGADWTSCECDPTNSVHMGAEAGTCAGHGGLEEGDPPLRWARSTVTCRIPNTPVVCEQQFACCPKGLIGWFTCEQTVNADCELRFVCSAVCCDAAPVYINLVQICDGKPVLYSAYACGA